MCFSEQVKFYVTDADSDEEPDGTQQEYYVDMPDTDEELEGTHQTTEDTQPTEVTQPMEGIYDLYMGTLSTLCVCMCGRKHMN
nr:hypothetical protein Iba_chr02aCG20970 [Ipomoea batatas]